MSRPMRTGKFAEEPTRPEQERFFFLNDVERDLIARRRSMHHQFGFAPQMCTVHRPVPPGRPARSAVAGGRRRHRPGLAAIRRVGDASPGDKALVDAFAPAAAALLAAKGVPPAEALAAAAEGAWQGVRDTAFPVARTGGASCLGRRATGIPYPGAVGVALLLASAGGSVDTLAHRVTIG
ncbi:DAK2 domain-containing protein [Streptomyces sp. NPDC048438]|uniref:DAK2 domain-containing protein n=1 Tax=Streptomyces sp. NPDC048438 TaxID=3365551 RepID=UPI00371D6EC8